MSALLKSCAMPPAIMPSARSRSCLTICSCVIAELLERVLQFDGPLPHLIFELQVQEAVLEQIADSQLHLGGVERLGDEVARARGERLAPGFRGDVGGEDDDRQEAVLGDDLLELLHHLVSVQVRHVQIGEHEVRLEFGEKRNRLPRVGGAPPLQAAEEFQHALQQPDVRRLVVHDKDLGRRNGNSGHGLW